MLVSPDCKNHFGYNVRIKPVDSSLRATPDGQIPKLYGSGGIRTHASERLVPKTSALDRSATLPMHLHGFCAQIEPDPPLRVPLDWIDVDAGSASPGSAHA